MNDATVLAYTLGPAMPEWLPVRVQIPGLVG